MLYCFLNLLFVQADFTFVLSFLAVGIIGCMECFIQDKRILKVMICIYLVSCIFIPNFMLFIPALIFISYHRRFYWILSAGALLCIAGVWTGRMLAMPEFCIIVFGCSLAVLLSDMTESQDEMERTIRTIRDDGVERNRLLAEKNKMLLEKQDYEMYATTLRERNRIAREIHDNVGHMLSRSILMVGALKAINKEKAAAEPLNALAETLDTAMDNIRSSVHDLHDEAVNLEEAVGNLVKDFTFCPVTLEYDMGRFIPKDVKYGFVSIIKEALSNVIRHSDATRVNIIVREHPGLYQLCVEDNGSGSAIQESGIGLMNMEERVSKLNGNIQFLTEEGFKIFITIPKENG